MLHAVGFIMQETEQSVSFFCDRHPVQNRFRRSPPALRSRLEANQWCTQPRTRSEPAEEPRNEHHHGAERAKTLRGGTKRHLTTHNTPLSSAPACVDAQRLA